MANSYIPGATNAILIGDSVGGATPSPTKVNSDKVNACLELQSTTRASIFTKPMTDVQIAAIPNPTKGMWAFSSDTNIPKFYNGNYWESINPSSGFIYVAGNLSTADIQGMYATPITILAAPGAGFTYVVHSARIEVTYATALFTGGGAISIQYGTTAAAGGTSAIETIPATFLTATASNKSTYVIGNNGTVLSTASILNQALSISNATAAFAAGGTSTATYELWYSIV